MNTFDSFDALRRTNPRAQTGFAESVEAVAERVRAEIVSTPTRRAWGRRLRASLAGAALAVAAATAALLSLGSPGGETATAAVEKAATLTAAAAERSGTAVVRITHDGEASAGSTIRWNGPDISVARDAPVTGGRKVGDLFRVVDGTYFGLESDGSWVAMGSPSAIDPDSGTTPAEYLAAVREDVGGVTLTRITGSMKGLTMSRLADGSTAYRGTVRAGLIAQETERKEGQSIRVLPFGFVAHDEAADASAPLETAVTVGPDGVVREVAVTWGTWRYSVAYSDLGATPAPVAPPNARSLLKERRP